MMSALRRAAACALAACVALTIPGGLAFAQKAFPYATELRLEAEPMRGSKRLPWLQFSESGAVEIDLWCATGRGRAVVVDRTITIMPTSLRDNQCSAAQLEADKDFLSKLMQVSAWRWEGVLLVLDGPEPLRWRPSTN
ncbi:META domain-containing protein [Pseudorhodoplanes sp.]|uniref:META domain-containing protein n=1 Tax=Pseudorhodoplanes sp. TaxID=1934341 RepID=UPI00391A85AF